jgi:hypothetical protein
MSLRQTCAEVQAVVARARSLFGNGEAVDVPSGAPNITSAAQAVMTARSRTSGLSGVGTTSYGEMADRAVPPLTTSATSDTRLVTHMTTAAAITQAGAARMEQIVAQTSAIAKVAPMAKSNADQRVILTALRSQVAQASQMVQATQQQASALAGQLRDLQYPKDAPAQALDHDLPQSPPSSGGEDPPHGKDPRYWIDVTKIVHVPDGQLAPNNSTQIGPGLFYPSPDRPGFATPPPPAAQWPLDMNDIVQVGPGKLGPYGTTELAPGVFAPTPNTLWPEPKWSPPQAPIDIRDIIEVPNGQLAPWAYKEYLPGWWAPDPSR